MLHRNLFNRLCLARRRLREHCDGGTPLRQIAKEAGLSTFRFIRLYKAVFGQTPAQCRIDARLQRARQLLSTGNCSVTEACMAVGYSSLGTFSRMFSRRMGLPPSAYRRGADESPAAPAPGCFCLMAGRGREGNSG